jgi:hypothetical protein
MLETDVSPATHAAPFSAIAVFIAAISSEKQVPGAQKREKTAPRRIVRR